MTIYLKCNCAYQPVLAQVNRETGQLIIKRAGFEVIALPPAYLLCGECKRRWQYIDGRFEEATKEQSHEA